MNNLKTTVAVGCSKKGEVTPYNGIVVSSLGERTFDENSSIKVDVRYYDEEGGFLMRKTPVYSKEQVNALYELVKGSIPSDATFSDLFETALISAQKIEMASTFGITVNQIEEVTE